MYFQYCVSYLSCCCGKIPWQQQLKGKGDYLGSQFKVLRVGSLQQRLEATGHAASAFRTQRGMNVCAHPPFPFSVSPGQSLLCWSPSAWVFSSQLTQSRELLYSQSLISKVILVKLTINVS